MKFLDDRLKRLIKNILGAGGARCINLFITLSMVPLTIKSLSTADYAFLAIAISLSNLSAFADLGMGLSLINVVAKGDHDVSYRAKRAISVVWFTLLFISALSLTIIGFLYWLLNYLSITDAGMADKYTAMLLGVVCVFVGLPSGIVQRVLMGLQKNNAANLWNTSGRLLSLGAIWLLVNLGYRDLYLFIFGVIGVPIVIGWLSMIIVFSRKSMINLRPSWHYCRVRLLRPYLFLGASYLVLTVVPFVETGIDSLLVGSLIDVKLVPAYDVYSKLFAYVPSLLSIGLFPLWPSIANAKANGDIAWVVAAKRWSYILVTIAALFSSSLLFIYCREIIDAWTDRLLFMDSIVIGGLAVSAILACFGLAQGMILNGIGQIRSQVIINSVYIVLLLVGKTLVAYYYGLIGMVWLLNVFYLFRLCNAEVIFYQSVASLRKSTA